MRALKVLCTQCSLQVWARVSSSTSVGSRFAPVVVADRPHLVEVEREPALAADGQQGVVVGPVSAIVSTRSLSFDAKSVRRRDRLVDHVALDDLVRITVTSHLVELFPGWPGRDRDAHAAGGFFQFGDADAPPRRGPGSRPRCRSRRAKKGDLDRVALRGRRCLIDRPGFGDRICQQHLADAGNLFGPKRGPPEKIQTFSVIRRPGRRGPLSDGHVENRHAALSAVRRAGSGMDDRGDFADSRRFLLDSHPQSKSESARIGGICG